MTCRLSCGGGFADLAPYGEVGCCKENRSVIGVGPWRTILQGQWWAQREGSRYREWLPLVCSSKIARCVVVVEVPTLAVLQRGADSAVAFPLVLIGG